MHASQKSAFTKYIKLEVYTSLKFSLYPQNVFAFLLVLSEASALPRILRALSPSPYSRITNS